MKDYQPAPDLLKDRTILVTGAGEGIGREAALAFEFIRFSRRVEFIRPTSSKQNA